MSRRLTFKNPQYTTQFKEFQRIKKIRFLTVYIQKRNVMWVVMSSWSCTLTSTNNLPGIGNGTSLYIEHQKIHQNDVLVGISMHHYIRNSYWNQLSTWTTTYTTVRAGDCCNSLTVAHSQMLPLWLGVHLLLRCGYCQGATSPWAYLEGGTLRGGFTGSIPQSSKRQIYYYKSLKLLENTTKFNQKQLPKLFLAMSLSMPLFSISCSNLSYISLWMGWERLRVGLWRTGIQYM